MTVLFEVALIVAAIQTGFADREHKVHNIVLYPEKNSWCQTTPIKQIVASTGYEPTTIDNNVCVGACFSYSIPRTQPAEPGELIGPYCDSCQPSETMCYHVTLKSDDKNSEQPRTLKKRVEIITNCSCMSCEKGQNKDCDIMDTNTSELPTDLFSILHPNVSVRRSGEDVHYPAAPDVPELMQLNGRNHTGAQYGKNDTSVADQNAKLMNLLKSIQEDAADDDDDSNFAYDKRELDNILEIVEKYRDDLNETNLMELVSFVNVENSESLHMDLTRLKDVLYEFKKKKALSERHRAFGLGVNLVDLGAKNNADVERDVDAVAQKYGLPKSFGVERNHIGMGLSENSVQHAISSAEGRGGRHYVGERQQVGFDAGHLAVGPHGSLVLAPDSKAQEKIHIDPDMLAPNHAGVVISYENHPKAPLDD